MLVGFVAQWQSICTVSQGPGSGFDSRQLHLSFKPLAILKVYRQYGQIGSLIKPRLISPRTRLIGVPTIGLSYSCNSTQDWNPVQPLDYQPSHQQSIHSYH